LRVAVQPAVAGASPLLSHLRADENGAIEHH
jgi:hypothetical protein